ncbi:MAG: hypothetical protein NT085_00280 [candidate division SR1 bacterium]|nr:hypothetical protein [candidate division SR1 bacterium]
MLIKDVLFSREELNDEPIVDSFVVELQILYKGEDFEDNIRGIYLEGLQSFNDENNTLERFFSDFEKVNDDFGLYEITHEEPADVENWHIHITIDFNYFDGTFSIEEIENFQNMIIEGINKNDNVLSMRKFRDDIQFRVYEAIYKDLYRAEMGLRKIISYIFLSRYYINENGETPDFVNFLKDINVRSSSPKYKDKDGIDEKNYENIFFYLLFSDYRNLLNLKGIESTKKYKKLLEKLREIKNGQDNEIIFDELDENYYFPEWAEEFGLRGIVKESHRDFIASIRDNMFILEEVRNAVMHFRNMDKRLMLNYMDSLNALNKKIEGFWENEKNFEDEDEFGLKTGETYEAIKDLPDFKKGKKYVLKYWNRHDAVFIGEKKKEVNFLDKELFEYFKMGK